MSQYEYSLWFGSFGLPCSGLAAATPIAYDIFFHPDPQL